jgi:hypothetical protein
MSFVLRKFRRLHFALLLGALAFVCAAGTGHPLPAQSAETEAVDSAREAFEASGSIPWYDPETDGPKPLKVPPYRTADDPNRRSNWEYTAGPGWTPPTPKTGTTTARPVSGLFGFSLFNLIGISLLLLLLGGLCVYLAWAFFKDDTEESSVPLGGAAPSVGGIDRVSELPLQVGNVRGDFLSAARREYEAGNYSQAVIYLFSYQLLALDRHQLIRLARGKTNRQYLREVRPRPELRSVLEQTMIAFEDVFFGKHAISRHRFESCWDRVDDFHRLLEHSAS